MAEKRRAMSELPTLIDSHCHLDMVEFDADRDAVLVRAREAGVEGMVIIGGVDANAGHKRALRVADALGFLLDRIEH